jgi:hypothetical protein
VPSYPLAWWSTLNNAPSIARGSTPPGPHLPLRLAIQHSCQEVTHFSLLVACLGHSALSRRTPCTYFDLDQYCPWYHHWTAGTAATGFLPAAGSIPIAAVEFTPPLAPPRKHLEGDPDLIGPCRLDQYLLDPVSARSGGPGRGGGPPAPADGDLLPPLVPVSYPRQYTTLGLSLLPVNRRRMEPCRMCLIHRYSVRRRALPDYTASGDLLPPQPFGTEVANPTFQSL